MCKLVKFLRCLIFAKNAEINFPISMPHQVRRAEQKLCNISTKHYYLGVESNQFVAIQLLAVCRVFPSIFKLAAVNSWACSGSSRHIICWRKRFWGSFCSPPVDSMNQIFNDQNSHKANHVKKLAVSSHLQLSLARLSLIWSELRSVIMK